MTAGQYSMKLTLLGPLGLFAGIMVAVRPDWAGPVLPGSPKAHKVALLEIPSMIFISSGNGLWIFGSAMISLLITVGLQHAILPPAHRVWPVTLGLAIAALVSFALGVQARLSRARLLLKRQTGRERMLRPVHSAYWIRVEYWSFLYAGLAIWMQTRNSS